MAMRSQEIEALVRRLFAARAKGNSESVINLFSESECFLAVGSDANEWWEGAEARELMLDTWALGPQDSEELERVEAFENDSTGWAVVVGRRQRPGFPPYRYNMTFVLQLEGGVWKIIFIQLAVLVADSLVRRIDLTPELAKLLDTVDHLAVSEAGARHTATVMITDIVGSTAISQAVGDSAWAAAVEDHMATLDRIVNELGGRVVKTMGDGGLYIFSSGGAALHAAELIQESLADPNDVAIRIRIGIHTGDLLESDHDLIGLTVHKAARVAAAARADQVLVSETTVGLVNDGEYRFGSPVAVELRGLQGNHVLYPLEWGHDTDPLRDSIEQS